MTAITAIDSQKDLDAVCQMADNAFRQNKITWKEHQMLADIIYELCNE